MFFIYSPSILAKKTYGFGKSKNIEHFIKSCKHLGIEFNDWDEIKRIEKDELLRRYVINLSCKITEKIANYNITFGCGFLEAFLDC